MTITLMNRRCTLKKNRHEYLSGQIVSYDGISGKYGAYLVLCDNTWERITSISSNYRGTSWRKSLVNCFGIYLYIGRIYALLV